MNKLEEAALEYESILRAYVADLEECERAFEYWNEMEARLNKRELKIAELIVKLNE